MKRKKKIPNREERAAHPKKEKKIQKGKKNTTKKEKDVAGRENGEKKKKIGGKKRERSNQVTEPMASRVVFTERERAGIKITITLWGWRKGKKNRPGEKKGKRREGGPGSDSNYRGRWLSRKGIRGGGGHSYDDNHKEGDKFPWAKNTGYTKNWK